MKTLKYILILLYFPAFVQAQDIRPILLVPHLPVYPEEALEHQIEGDVEIELDVSSMGIPKNIKVVSADNELFVESSLKVTKKLKFKPMLSDGKLVDVKGYRIVYEFRFSGKETNYSVHLTNVSTGAGT